MIKFVKENLNPKGKKVGDCVIRAIAKVEGKRWFEIFDELCIIARDERDIPISKKVYEKYLTRLNYIPINCQPAKGGKRHTVKTFAELYNTGSYVVAVAGHLTAVVEGTLYDTWNCQNSCVYKAYKKWEYKGCSSFLFCSFGDTDI